MYFICAYVYEGICAFHVFVCGSQRRALSILLYYSAPYSVERGSLIEMRARLAIRNPQQSSCLHPQQASLGKTEGKQIFTARYHYRLDSQGIALSWHQINCKTQLTLIISNKENSGSVHNRSKKITKND